MKFIHFTMLLNIVQGNVHAQKCAKSEECDATKNLDCKDGVCHCKEDKLYWNAKAVSCG